MVTPIPAVEDSIIRANQLQQQVGHAACADGASADL